ncbi:MAG: Dihydroorotase [Candidatus Bipolaricaulis sibiricus]|uniref:Dihydroorotase n=1 Tax=Bipolaricaulis sibiricus TaxID=2501609 RepID=A0A410FSB4_BIPS1|nr:MAG: Dihydroorotase [Candidatus Bipolaricaulis sibiricus]
MADVRLVGPDGAFHKGDILIHDGRIAAVGTNLDLQGLPVLQGQGRVALPAFVDLHAHFRDPGFPEKEDTASGSAAAVRGGFTAVSLMANTHPTCDNPEVARYVVEKARQVGLVEVYPVGAITRGLAGQEVADLEGLAPYVWAFSDDGKGVERHDLMIQAGKKARALGKVIMEHCESPGLGELGEELMAARDLWLAHRLGFRLHLTHLTSPRALDLVAWARSQGVQVTCDGTPHHLTWPREEGDYVVNPPLVDRPTHQALVEALRAGTFDAIATDHAPHTREAKAQGAPGISGIEVAFSLLHTRLVQPGLISLAQLVHLLSEGPARILGLHKGRLAPGYDGDVVLVEEETSFVVTPEFFWSKSHNTPILGTRLSGQVWATVRKGTVVYLDGHLRGRDFDDHRQVVGSR